MDVRGFEERGRCRQADEGPGLARKDRQGEARLRFRFYAPPGPSPQPSPRRGEGAGFGGPRLSTSPGSY